MTDDLSIQDSLLNDSRISASGNGNESNKPVCTQPTGGQKWWAAVIVGFLFAIFSSPVAYQITTQITDPSMGIKTIQGKGPTTFGLFLHMIIFILVIRLILW